MHLIKLTDEHGQTKNKTQWGPNITHTAIGDPSKDLCSDAYIHAYESIEIALLMNPIGANFDPKTMQIWNAKGKIIKNKDHSKCGCRSLTTISLVKTIPILTREIRIRFAIFCSLKVYKEQSYVVWAENWIDNKDRSANAAADAAAYAANAAAYAAAYAAYDAYAAYAAAKAAANAAANAAADATIDFNLLSLAKQAFAI